MDELTIEMLTALHRPGDRQGPGGDDETRLAVQLSGLKGRRGLRIADIGCGTGASTRVLAGELDATITAVDFLPAFLDKLEAIAAQEGWGDPIATLSAAMEELPFESESLDAIWAEGAIYNMGFAEGVRTWRRFLKPGGILAVSELTWLTAERPEELTEHWMAEYPQVATAGAKLSLLESEGFKPVGYFPLGRHCWLDNYYRPLQERLPAFLERFENSEAARELAQMEEKEIALYERNADFVSYGYYVASKVD
jgi:SAM-dependent methyltransferase